MHNRFITFIAALAMVIAPRPALGGNKAQQRLAKLTWSVYTYTSYGAGFSRPVCHKLGYFLGSPLRFDYGRALAEFKSNHFTYTGKTSLIGMTQGERIYQVVQRIHANSEKTPGESMVMKRLLVERRRNVFCMIFQEQGTIGPPGTVAHVKPATIKATGRGPVLRTDDPLNGVKASHINASWLFLRGVPVPLSLPNNLVEQLAKPVMPESCGMRPGNTRGNLRLAYHSPLWRSEDSSSGTTCGSVVLKLSVSNHKLVLLTRNYIP